MNSGNLGSPLALELVDELDFLLLDRELGSPRGAWSDDLADIDLEAVRKVALGRDTGRSGSTSSDDLRSNPAPACGDRGGDSESHLQIRRAQIEQADGVSRTRASHIAGLGDRCLPSPDGILGDVDDDNVGRAELEPSLLMDANPGDDLRDHFLVVTRVRDHRESRLDLIEHVANCVMRGVRLVDRRIHDDGWHAELQRLEVGGVRLHFGHEYVYSL